MNTPQLHKTVRATINVLYDRHSIKVW